MIKAFEEVGIILCVEYFCDGICGFDEEFFRTAEEGGNSVDVP